MVDLIPRDVLFGNPERLSPAVSPDGRRLAHIAPVDGILNVWVGTLGGDDAKPVSNDRERGVRSFAWCPNNRHIVYPQDTGGDENWHLRVVDLESGGDADVTPFDGVQARILAADRRRPNHLLVGLNRRNPELHDAYLLDVRDGSLELVAENPGFAGWLVDTELAVRGGLAFLPDGGVEIRVGDPKAGDYRTLLAVGSEDAITTDVAGFTHEGDAVYLVTSKDANAARLLRMDLATGAFEVLAADPTYDVSDVLIHPETHHVQAVTFTRERADHVVLDPSIAADVEAMKALHPGDLHFRGRDLADRMWIVGFTADDGPVAYYAYDRESGGATFLFAHKPDLAAYTLAQMEPFAFTTRDGLQVHGYLTFPPGSDRTREPAVLFVHGGPWARDEWGFAPDPQWLANRGYLCIQVNYRGSTGYGKDFLNAGDREWGARMHDDLLDAVAWAVEQGHADPGRIAIYGGSYGGYAALVGATFTPDVFCCAIDVVGPSDLRTLIRSIPPYWAPLVAQFHKRVGNPDTEPDFLWSRSPLSKVDQIRIPMLIAQGANDPRVKKEESEQIVAAMEQRGIPHRYLVFADEGHGFRKPENNLAFHAAAEEFLAEHVGGRLEPAHAPETEIAT
jgi:dipeptidyl aminopeptidase/acylaminoacyl peptidase